LSLPIVCAQADEETDAPHSFRLLGTRCKRPNRRRATEQRDEFPSSHRRPELVTGGLYWLKPDRWKGPLMKALEADDPTWRRDLPGRTVFNKFASVAGMQPGRLKQLY
jgi:hypothetical protein